MKYIKIFLALLALFLVGCSPKSDYSMVSVDSLRTSSCEEIHDNFNQCRLQYHGMGHNNPEMMNYCANFYIPFYVKKCVEDYQSIKLKDEVKLCFDNTPTDIWINSTTLTQYEVFK